MEKNSVNVQNSRYVSGGQTEVSGNRLEWWERTKFEVAQTDTRFIVDVRTEGRLDLIAAAMLGDSHLWWLIAQYNAILDPFGEVSIGRILRIPTKDRAQMMLGGQTGGVASTRTVPVQMITPVV